MSKITNEFLEQVLNEIRFKYDQKEIKEELVNHIQDSIDDLMNEGYTKEEAEKEAVFNMGDAKEIGQQLDLIHNPIQGWIWRISVWVRNSALVFLAFIVVTSLLRLIINYNNWDSFNNVKNEIKINETIETDRNKYIFRSIYYIPDDKVAISYRINYLVNNLFRQWHVNDVKFYSKDGHFLSGGGGHGGDILGVSGNYSFDVPSDDEIIIMLEKDTKFILNLSSGLISEYTGSEDFLNE